MSEVVPIMRMTKIGWVCDNATECLRIEDEERAHRRWLQRPPEEGERLMLYRDDGTIAGVNREYL